VETDQLENPNKTEVRIGSIDYRDDPRVTYCPGCNRPTRRPRVKAADCPGTASWGGADHCSACYKPGKREGYVPLTDQVKAQRQAHTETGLEKFMARRTQRKTLQNRKAQINGRRA
jgi:hypothetical protein